MVNSEPNRSIGPLLLWSAVCLVLLGAAGQPIPTNDLHIFLAMGQSMADTGQLLERETFTWTAHGTEFLHGPWGFSWLAWTLYDSTGFIGLRLFNGLAAAGTLVLLGRAALLRGVDPRAAAFGCFFAGALMIENLSIRSQTWAFPLFAALLWCMAIPRKPLFVGSFCLVCGCLWANLHGSFPAGLVALGALGAGAVLDKRSLRAASPSVLAAAAFGIGTLIGPYGPEIYAYVLNNSSAPEARGLSEWGAPELMSFAGIRLALALVIWAALILIRRGKIAFTDWVIVVAFAGLALTGTRFIAWFGIAAAVPLAVVLSDFMTPNQGGMPPKIYRGVLIAVGTYWVLVLGNALAPKAQELHEDTPIEAVAALAKSAKTGRLFNPPEWGGYATLTLGDAWQTSGDIRVWVFDDPSWRVYPTLVQAPEGWEEALDAREVTHLLLQKKHFHALLIEPARSSPSWQLLHEDDFSAAFERVQ